MLSPDDVETAFRLILGRPPESEAVIEGHRRVGDLARLRRVLLESPEFARAFAAIDAERAAAEAAGEPETERPARLKGTMDARKAAPQVYDDQGILLEPNPVETALDPALRDRLWARVAESWAALGRSAPHWSVLTHERFRPEALDENREEFALSGRVEGMLVDAALARFPDLEPAGLHCLEIGCGVGRATRALAARFATVEGVDISAEHLAVAEAEFAAEGIANVTLTRVATVGDYAALAPADVFYSRIVLQHNPPPIQVAILEAAFAGLNPGGVALFQLVTHAKGYAYDPAADLARAPGEMEMHALPQPRVFALMATHGLAPVEVQEDFAGGLDSPYRSHLFLARKAGGAA